MLLQLARGIFEEQTSLESVVHKIMKEAITLLKCERCLVFLLEDHDKSVRGKRGNQALVIIGGVELRYYDKKMPDEGWN